MTEDQFTELINLYLDKEISPEQLKLLKSEIEGSSDRKKTFDERCRLHQAMRLALNSDKLASVPHDWRASRPKQTGERSGRIGDHSATRDHGGDRVAGFGQTIHFPRWILGSGAAASLLLAVFLLPQVLRESSDVSSRSPVVGLAGGDLAEQDPLNEIGKSELRRFAAVRKPRGMNQNASLVAQMHLLGLSPELTPEKKELREVSQVAVQPRRRSISQAELLQQIQEYRAIPEMELIQIEAADSSIPAWSSTFQSSLVSFGE